MSKKMNTVVSVLIVASILIILNVLVMLRVIDEYASQVLTIAGINVIIALGLNLISGFTGQLALGHAGFMAVGAYDGGLMMKLHLPTLVAVFGGALMSAFFGFLIGLPTLRLRGDYLAIVTLGFGEIIRVLMINLPELTGGPAGLKGIPTFTTNFFWRPVLSFALVYLTMTLVVVLLNNLLNSSHGAAIISIREDEIAANAMGINVFYYKIFAFTLSAFIGGLGGALYAPFFGYLSPNMFNFPKVCRVSDHCCFGWDGEPDWDGGGRDRSHLSPRNLAFSQRLPSGNLPNNLDHRNDLSTFRDYGLVWK